MTGPLRRLGDLLFPPRCVFCHDFLPGHPAGALCPRCRELAQGRWRCRGARTLPFVDGTVPSALFYQGAVRAALLRYKFHHRPGYRRVFAALLLAAIDGQVPQHVDAVTWVPSGFGAWRRRGYNPGRLLAKALARALGKPAVPLLCKRPFVPQQAKTARADRRGNILGAFRPRRRARRYRMGRVLLIDDVLTTGATLSECAKTLKLSGVGWVFAATFARTPGKKH